MYRSQRVNVLCMASDCKARLTVHSERIFSLCVVLSIDTNQPICHPPPIRWIDICMCVCGNRLTLGTQVYAYKRLRCIVNTKLVLCPFHFPHNNKWNGPKGARFMSNNMQRLVGIIVRWKRSIHISAAAAAATAEVAVAVMERKKKVYRIDTRWPIAMNVAHNNILYASILISGRYRTFRLRSSFSLSCVSHHCARLIHHHTKTVSFLLLWLSFLVDVFFTHRLGIFFCKSEKKIGENFFKSNVGRCNIELLLKYIIIEQRLHKNTLPSSRIIDWEWKQQKKIQKRHKRGRQKNEMDIFSS